MREVFYIYSVGFLMFQTAKQFFALGAVAVLLSACSVTGIDGVADPIENVNRGIFKFNDVVDTAVIAPVAKGYRAAVPKPARVGVRNVIHNLKTPQYVANNLLQGNLAGASDDTTRFFANTLFGLGGIIDVAGAEGVKYKEEDFGQTLGKWGVGSGAYVVLPLYGPSTLRDTAGLIVDSNTDPLNLWLNNTDREGYYYGRLAVSAVDKREELLDVLADLKKNSIDYYAATKSAYLQRRAALVGNQNGDVPDMP